MVTSELGTDQGKFNPSYSAITSSGASFDWLREGTGEPCVHPSEPLLSTLITYALVITHIPCLRQSITSLFKI